MEKYRKAIVAAAAFVVEAGALWLDAPSWFVGLVGLAAAVLVYSVKNEPMPTTTYRVRD